MSTLTTINGSDVISTSRTVINSNFSALNTDKIETSTLDTDTTLANNSDSKIATQKAVKAYVLANVNPTGASWNEYAADAGSTDAYVITLTGLVAYATGQTFKFKANTANTGAATLKVNSLAAITIKKDVTTDLATGDILANQQVVVIYDGTNMQLVSEQSGLAKTADLPTQAYTVGALSNALVKTYFNVQLLFILWTGAVNADTTTTFANWVRSDATDVFVAPGGMAIRFQSTGASSIFSESESLFGTSVSQLTFAMTNIVIADWWAQYNAATDTGDSTMGFSTPSSGALDSVYNSTTYDRVAFTKLGSTGVLYATIAKPTVGVTNTDISSGLTLTNWNNYRIELDLSNNAKFYVNGVLKATLSGANLPTTNGVSVGFGRSNTALFAVTAPTISLQMNP